jgi:hypothetical protein
VYEDIQFRTVGSQTKINTDNSGVIAAFTSLEQNTDKLAVGRITDLYVHCLNGKKVGEDGALWTVFVKADWFEPVQIHPVNGLLQVQENKHWDRCGIVDIGQCHALNCVFWPSDPLRLEQEERDQQRTRKHGKKRKRAHDDEMAANPIPILFDVITHHDDDQVLLDLSKCFDDPADPAD